MTKKSRKRRGTLAVGRPSVPAEQRAERRITTRLYAHDESMLEQLCTKLDCTEGDVIRTALRLLAQQHHVIATLPKTTRTASP